MVRVDNLTKNTICNLKPDEGNFVNGRPPGIVALTKHHWLAEVHAKTKLMTNGEQNTISRRKMLQCLGVGGLSIVVDPTNMALETNAMLQRPIPSSGEMLPVVGLGTWIQFDVGSSASERQPLLEVLKRMARHGGKTIDSSPMYGNSEHVIGDLTSEANNSQKFFFATKVWTSGERQGISQMEESLRKMRRKTIDLMQVHNLLDWKTHLHTLKKWKSEGKVRYVGITHYTDSYHSELEQILQSEKLDFVQFNYSIRGRHAEQRLLKAAKDKGVAVIINQPFDSGRLFDHVSGKKLPEWAADFGIKNWAQFFLKFILSNDAVTCVIPGTSNPDHLDENMGAAYGRLPDGKTRRKMVETIEAM
jgi:diketogulonate reductase-like aldo/keto reductase